MSGHDSCRRKKDLKSQGKSSFGSRNALSNLLIPYHNLWDLMVRNSPDRNQCRFINLLNFSSRFILNAKCFWFKSVSGWAPTHVCQFIVSRWAIRLFFALRIIRDPFEFRSCRIVINHTCTTRVNIPHLLMLALYVSASTRNERHSGTYDTRSSE